MPLAAVASMLIVLVAWLIYGDWGVAWNVGACFVPTADRSRELVASYRASG